MKIFLTGGTGFIGSHFVPQALDAGCEVTALRRSPSSVSKIPWIRDPEWLDRPLDQVSSSDLQGVDCIVHLAAHSANVPYDSLEECLQQNVLQPLILFRRATQAGIRRFVVAGSCFEYGTAGERYEFIPVDAPLEPTTSYPASKAAASVAFHSFACEEKLELLIARIFQVYGEGESENRFWPTLRRAALAGEDLPMTEGDQVRDFIQVSEVAARLLDLALHEVIPPGYPIVKNIGTGNPMSLADFARSQWKDLGATGRLLLGSVPKRDGEILRYVPEI